MTDPLGPRSKPWASISTRRWTLAGLACSAVLLLAFYLTVAGAVDRGEAARTGMTQPLPPTGDAGESPADTAGRSDR